MRAKFGFIFGRGRWGKLNLHRDVAARQSGGQFDFELAVFVYFAGEFDYHVETSVDGKNAHSRLYQIEAGGRGYRMLWRAEHEYAGSGGESGRAVNP